MMVKRMKECKHNTSLVLSYKKARVSKKWFIFSEIHWGPNFSTDVVGGRRAIIVARIA